MISYIKCQCWHKWILSNMYAMLVLVILHVIKIGQVRYTAHYCHLILHISISIHTLFTTFTDTPHYPFLHSTVHCLHATHNGSQWWNAGMGNGGMQEWVIQIPSIPILVSVLFPSLHLNKIFVTSSYSFYAHGLFTDIWVTAESIGKPRWRNILYDSKTVKLLSKATTTPTRTIISRTSFRKTLTSSTWSWVKGSFGKYHGEVFLFCPKLYLRVYWGHL